MILQLVFSKINSYCYEFHILLLYKINNCYALYVCLFDTGFKKM